MTQSYHVDFLDAAWTASLFRGLLLGLFTLSLALPISWFYRDSRLADLMLLASVIPVLQGVQSVGLTVGLYRSMDFQRVAMVNSIASIVGSITTLATAFLLRNAWALLLGQVATNICLTVLSYLTARRRPRLDISWSKWAEMWRFGRWEWAAALAYSLYHDGDDLFVGKVLGASALGFYRMGYRLAKHGHDRGRQCHQEGALPGVLAYPE